MITYGYARVSTRDQNFERQIEVLKAEGCTTIYSEKISGIRTVRPQLVKMMKRIEAGDFVIVTKLDRLGRSTRELLELIEFISSRGAFFKSIGDPMFDTKSPTGRLLTTLLAAVAEFERSLISERTTEGRKRAQAHGVVFGRPSKLTRHQEREVSDRLKSGEPQTEIAKSYNVSRACICRYAKKAEANLV